MKKLLLNFLAKEAFTITLKVALLVFVLEIAIMTLFKNLGIVNANTRIILDAILLVLVITPFFHFLFISPTITASQIARKNAFAYQEKEEQLRFVLQGSDLGFWDWDIVKNEVHRNARWAEMLGFTDGEIQNTTKQWTDFIHPDDREKAWQSINDVLEGRFPAHKCEYRMLHKDGSIRWVLDQAKVIQRDIDGKPTRMSGTHTDISDRKQSEVDNDQNSLLIKRILDNLFAYVALLDNNGVVLEVNKAPLERAGYRREDVIGQYFYDAPWWNYDEEVRAQLISAMHDAKQGKSSRYDVVVKMGEDLVPIDFLIAPVRDGFGQIVGLLPTAVDITERKQLEDELNRQAHLDYLTGLPNRRSFMERFEQELSRSQRYDNTMSILMLDIDLFKQVNDAYGHQAGDQVLKTLAMIFQEEMRSIDIVGRLGGEEFGMVLTETSIEKAVEVAERLREVISKTEVTLSSGIQIHFTVSIGVATLMDKNMSIDMLLNESDKALYRAKQDGRNKVCV
jgi:diguanylate cyclase (GGDEF)-like protein/PAS domain S-box-containing protein